MRGGPRVKRFYQGKCLVDGCNLPMIAGNLCNKHYVRDYFAREPKSKLDRGCRSLRQETIAVELSQLIGLTKIQSYKVINTVLDTIVTSLKLGESVYIAGFGTFGVHNRNKFVYGHNVYFIPAKELKEMIKQGEVYVN